MEIIMRLSFDEIKSVTFGAHSIECDGGVLRFHKCTDKQEKAFAALSDTLYQRSLTTTGVRLDFHTNSKKFAFKVLGSGFELYVDGMLRGRYVKADGADGVETSVSLTDPIGNEKESYRIMLAFPSHSVGALEYVELDDGATFSAHKHDMKLLFIGDSITQGFASSMDTLSYAWRVTQHYNADSIINGIGGAYFHTTVFDKPSFEPDSVIIAYGTNDWGRYPDYNEMYGHVCGFLDLVKEAYGECRVFVISPIWRAKGDGEVMDKAFDNRRKMIEREAEKRGFIAINGLDMVPPCKALYKDVCLHPNDNGFAFYAENLIKKLDPYLL